MLKPPTAFFDNDAVTHHALVIGLREGTRQRIAEKQVERILLVQDTTSFDFKHHPHTTGMGRLENAHTSGFLAHTSMVVTTTGLPLGIWEQQIWSRPEDEVGKRDKRHERAFEDKESYKWVKGLPDMDYPLEPQVITVCDREAHIYEFMDEVVGRSMDVIVRACKGRAVTPEDEDVFECVAQFPVQMRYRLTVKRTDNQQSREAIVEMRYGQVTLKRPSRATSLSSELTLTAVEVKEVNTPKRATPVHWLILTTCPVSDIKQAQQIITWYGYRWLIERFHYVMKSGCQLEERQLQQRERLERLLGVFNWVAWQLLWLTYQARATPDALCLVALEEDEWQALYATIHKTLAMPPTPPTLSQVVGWIAQLGGFLGRKGDGNAGVKTLWQGWMRLQDIVATWRLFQPPLQDVGKA